MTGPPALALPPEDPRPPRPADPEGEAPGSRRPFTSILFEGAADGAPTEDVSSVFHDLNLDQVVARATAGREEYALDEFFARPLPDVRSIHYRHEILQDLERAPVRAAVDAFAQSMRATRQALHRSDAMRDRRQRASWRLDAAGAYCNTVRAFADELTRAEPRSRGLSAFMEALRSYRDSPQFEVLERETREVASAISAVHYTLFVRGSRVTVARTALEADLAQEVAAAFQRFRQGAVGDHHATFRDRSTELNPVEIGILDRVENLYPDVFQRLDEFQSRHHDFVDPTLRAFDREVQFYLAYLDFVGPLKAAGLRFCYPELSGVANELSSVDSFDLALADLRVHARSNVVTNGFSLNDPERILVVTGPNQGGKTTFARAFGQIHALARLGLPVPGTTARLALCDRIFSHFEREEHIENLRGKLHDELLRLHAILGEATERSLVVINESFSTTTAADALLLGRAVLREVLERGILCVYVTFIDELSALDPRTVSFVATVSPQDPTIRTFKIVRAPADGRAYAVALAEKYGITYDALRSRLGV